MAAYWNLRPGVAGWTRGPQDARHSGGHCRNAETDWRLVGAHPIVGVRQPAALGARALRRPPQARRPPGGGCGLDALNATHGQMRQQDASHKFNDDPPGAARRCGRAGFTRRGHNHGPDFMGKRREDGAQGQRPRKRRLLLGNRRLQGGGFGRILTTERAASQRLTRYRIDTQPARHQVVADLNWSAWG